MLNKKKDIEYPIGDRVFLKVSPWRKVLLAHHLALPSELERIHNIFHASMLRRYRFDPSHVISPVDVEIQLDMLYSEEPI
ncbi:receptor-like protein kinase [Gossypium australe]|uniref:Receptor-like protein kinase n=1 Tax=Gossypium australe TaxID=47621 RepID=A0A5B6UYI9_9ROSI|nr:receptor-like protein kinase [Gossypium australe]